MKPWLVVVVVVALVACKHHENPPPAPAPAPAPKPAAPATSDADAACAKAHAEGPLAWIADDYAAAVTCAKARHRPIVVDLWAPWCHTCLSMQSTVFQDPSFAADKDRFVFVALDTDRDVNAPALAKLAPSAWPTFYVLGEDEQVRARWVGAASLAQFHQLLDAGARAGTGGDAAADAHLLGANRALAVKDVATADAELTAALAAAPADWPDRAETLGTLIMTKRKRGDLAGCLTLAEQHLGETGNAAVASDFLVTAMECADAREKDEAARVKALRERAVTRWQELLGDPKAQLSVDDRSDAMASLRETLDDLGRHDEAKATAEKQRALLDDAAGHAKDPMAAMTYNWPREEVYVYLGRPLDLVPSLEQSAKDLPHEYDPPYRLGWLYWKAGKLDLAAKWTDQALALAYGPRKGRVLDQRAEIAAAAGDAAGARSYREQEVKLYESLPPSQQSPDALAKAKAALAAPAAPPPAAAPAAARK